MNPEMTTPLGDLAWVAVLANVGMILVFGRVKPRVRAWVAKRAGKAKR